MKILLVLPAIERMRVTREHPDVPSRKMLRFSVLPLTTVAALTPAEHAVHIVDENVEALDLDAECDLVGITFMTALAPRAYEIAAHFRGRGQMVVAGGYHPTLCPDDAAPHFDALVLGDAEEAWPRLLADHQSGQLQRTYRSRPAPIGREDRPPQSGLSDQHSGAQVSTDEDRAPAGARHDLLTPVSRRDLLAHTARHYATINAVQAGRGCPHQCRYCSVTVFHDRQYRHRPVADIVAELRHLPRDFIFVDDNIMADRVFAADLFRALIPLRKRWVSQSALIIAEDPELLQLAHAAGCCGLFIGIETANEENLAWVSKRFNQSARYPERLRKIRAAGIGVVAGMIFGLDGDDAGVFQRTLRFLEETQIDAVQANILTPLPGTPLYADLDRAGRVTARDWAQYDFRHVVFRPERMTAEELQAGTDWVIAEFYRLDRIWWRFVRAIVTVGLFPAILGLRLGLTYRYDVKRGGIRGRDPAGASSISTIPGLFAFIRPIWSAVRSGWTAPSR